MKKQILRTIIISAIMLLSGKLLSQDKDQFHSLSLITSPGTYIDFGHKNYTDDGFNFGLQYEHQNNTVYYGGELFVFPNLNKYDYAHIIGRFGFNIKPEFGALNKPLRLHVGPRIGFIARETANFGQMVLLGFEIGVEFTFADKYFIGGVYAYDSKTDSKPIWGEDNHQVNTFYLKTGIRW